MSYYTRGLGAALLFAVVGVSHAGTPCDEVKSKLEAKIKSHGVKAFTLDVVATGDAKDAKVVGVCEGGKKQIVYKRG